MNHGARSEKFDEARFTPAIDSARLASLMMPAVFAVLESL